MPKRYLATLPMVSLRLFSALRERLKEGYNFSHFRSDLMAGIVVGMVAVPLGMALAIAVGVAPQYGLYTVIVGGGVVALLGGSRFQVTGPTAAFVVVLVPVVRDFGFPGLLVAGLMAGLILILLGLARMGKLIQFIPHPVTTGFTAGIAVVIATLQIKDFLGLSVPVGAETFLQQVVDIGASLGTLSPVEFSAGLMTLSLLLLWPKFNTKIPAPLIALSVVTIVFVLLKKFFPSLEVTTIGTRFTFDINGVTGHGIPQMLPQLEWPWNRGDGGFQLNLATIQALAPAAFTIAMLGAIESLLSAVVADGMARTKHDPDGELLALGIGNVLCPFFGGIPATGAIARTATNIRFGASSPISAVIHALFTMLVILLFAPLVSYLPMAALAALLIVVAYNMAQVGHFTHILRVAPKSDVIILLMCFFLTVIFDMVVGVTVGIVLAALLFMRRMAEVTGGHAVDAPKELGLKDDVPKGVLVYVIEGPMFFGAAEKASQTLPVTDQIHTVIFELRSVPAMDVTGLVALESAIRKLRSRGKEVGLADLRSQPRELIEKSGLIESGQVWVENTLEAALARFK
jgi:SulP family sulfate permease